MGAERLRKIGARINNAFGRGKTVRSVYQIRVMHSNELRTIAEEEVGEVLRQLPDILRTTVERVNISYEQAPAIADVEDGLIGDELGLFEGPSLIDDPGIEEMPQIRLFLANLWDWVDGDLVAYREEVATTFLHELGHFLGWDEDEIAERGLD